MTSISRLTALEAQKELTEAVKETQGSKRTASWKAEAKPCWWINDHTVTLPDGTQVSTGTFDVVARRKWKKSQLQAALCLYEQWKSGETGSPETKEEAKVEERVEEEVEPAPRRTRRAKKEEQILQELSPRPRNKGRGKGKSHIRKDVADTGTSEPVEDPEEEEGENQTPMRGQRDIRPKRELVIPDQTLSTMIPKTRSSRQSPSSSTENNESSTPIIHRRARRHGKAQKTSPQIQTPLQKRPKRAGKPRTGKAVVRNTTKTESKIDSIPISRGSTDVVSNSATPSRLSKPTLSSDSDVVHNRTRRRLSEHKNPTSPVPQNDGGMLPRLSGTSRRSSLTLDPSTTGKRPITDVNDHVRTEQPRAPLQERNNRSHMRDRRLKKKRKIVNSDNALSDKENQVPQADAEGESVRLRSSPGKDDKAGEPDVDLVETETTNMNDEDKEAVEAADEAAEQQGKASRIRFLRDQIAKAKAIRDREHQLIDREKTEFETRCSIEKRKVVDALKGAYKTLKLKFSKEILDMPVSTFANEHGGNTDEWLIRETEQGVNRTFEALINGEDPKVFGMREPKTPAAKSRLAALTKTARKTQRRVANEAAAAGLTVRRSQRTAAKIATERTRAIVSCTPRTVKNEVSVQRIEDTTPSVSRVPAISSAWASLAQSVRKDPNPTAALRELRALTDQLQREVLEASGLQQND